MISYTNVFMGTYCTNEVDIHTPGIHCAIKHNNKIVYIIYIFSIMYIFLIQCS